MVLQGWTILHDSWFPCFNIKLIIDLKGQLAWDILKPVAR